MTDDIYIDTDIMMFLLCIGGLLVVLMLGTALVGQCMDAWCMKRAGAASADMASAGASSATGKVASRADAPATQGRRKGDHA